MTSGERDGDPIARARALADAGEPRRAADLLRTRLSQGRGGILMRLALGRMELAAGDTASALETLRDVCELSPGLAEAAFAMGEALLAANALPAAIAELERALRLDPGHRAAALALGRAWLEAGEANRAKAMLAPLAQPGLPLADEAAEAIAQADRVLSLSRAAPGYVRHLFDQFSADYDARMLENLSYRAPGILRGLADLMLGTPENPLAVLDLGCGTGLEIGRAHV